MPNRSVLPERRVLLALVLGVSVRAICLMAAFAGCSGLAARSPRPGAPNYAVAHGKMMLKIEETGVKDLRVLDALRKVPRHEFAPEDLAGSAYLDAPILIADGVEMPRPSLFAKMAELLGLKGGEKVLQLSTGTGYQAAVLSRMARQVFSVEIVPHLTDSAARRLTSLGYANVSVRCSDPTAGWEQHAPFDAIIVTDPVPRIPQALVNQLKEGGRLIVAVGPELSERTLKVVTKLDGRIMLRDAITGNALPETGQDK